MRLGARKIYGGKARSEALVLPGPLSLLGGVDRETGELLDEKTGLRGESVAGKILVFPRGKGSTAGSYVLYSLSVRKRAPAALVCHTAEAVVATGAILGETTMVDGVQTDLFRTGDEILVDADHGYVEIEGLEVVHVVTAFLRSAGGILLLKRSQEVKSFPGHWAGVSGFLEEDEDPLLRARLEIHEETGISVAELVSSGDVVYARGDRGPVWAVHPFLFEVDRRDVSLDWEHIEFRWIAPEELDKYETVPKLAEALRSALSGPSSGR